MASHHLEQVVADYDERFRRNAQRELACFEKLPTEEAVSRAGLAELPSGKRHSHQRRISRSALEESRRRLLDNLPLLRKAKSFDELHELIGRVIGPIHGIGELAVYDTALRIGARFRLEPSRVYLHAGTRDGAKALGLDWKCAAIEMHDLPHPLRRLTAREAEDVLCIYKDGLVDSARPCHPPKTRRGNQGGC